MKKIILLLFVSLSMAFFSCNSKPSAKKMAEEYCRLVEEYNKASKAQDLPGMKKALEDRKAIMEKVAKGQQDGDPYIMTFVKETNGCRDQSMIENFQ